MDVIASESDIVISAGTVAEALIVASRRNVGPAMQGLIERLKFRVVPVTEASAIRVAEAYRSWGKGTHPAGLNFGDCFAYEVAITHGCKLLYVGNGFSQTDLIGAVSWAGSST